MTAPLLSCAKSQAKAKLNDKQKADPDPRGFCGEAMPATIIAI